MLPVSFVTSSDPVGGVLPFLERLFGVKEYECCLLCLAFRNDCCRVLLVDLFCEGWLWHVLCVAYNFSRLRLFCAGSGLTVLLCAGKIIYRLRTM